VAPTWRISVDVDQFERKHENLIYFII